MLLLMNQVSQVMRLMSLASQVSQVTRLATTRQVTLLVTSQEKAANLYRQTTAVMISTSSLDTRALRRSKKRLLRLILRTLRGTLIPLSSRVSWKVSASAGR